MTLSCAKNPVISTVTPGGHYYGNGERWPLRLCGERGMGVSRDASGQERHHVWLLLWPIPRHYIHASSEAPFLLLHLQSAPAVLPYLFPGSTGLLPACWFWGEGLTRGDGAAGSDSVSDDGGREHASFRKRSTYWWVYSYIQFLVDVDFSFFLALIAVIFDTAIIGRRYLYY